MLTIEEALELVAANVVPLAPRRILLSEALGLVLAEDCVSDIDSPPHTKSLMDGYAVLSSDRAPVRVVLEEVAAGAVPSRPVVPGTATRIMTGAPLPSGADAVVPIEKTELIDGGTSIELREPQMKQGQHVLLRGTSMRAGQIVVRARAQLRPVEVAILAEAGRSFVLVYPRPRVAILPTGNEIIAVDQRPAIGQIRNSNGPMLMALVTQAGGDAVDCGIGRDDPDDLRRRIGQGFGTDVLLLSGGVSAGKFDLVPQILRELGVEQVFHKISLRPGKPLWFGVKQHNDRRTLVFGLPGNPVSSFVCFQLFVRPAIAALAGRGFAKSAVVKARLTHAYEHSGGRAAYLPARLSLKNDDDSVPVKSAARAARLLAESPPVEILPWQGSADLAALANATCLARLSAERISLRPDELIDVLLI